MIVPHSLHTQYAYRLQISVLEDEEALSLSLMRGAGKGAGGLDRVKGRAKENAARKPTKKELELDRLAVFFMIYPSVVIFIIIIIIIVVIIILIFLILLY